MTRFYAALAVFAFASGTFAADLPKGTWRKTFEEGSSWTLTLDGKGAKWVGQSATAGTTTLVAPVCVLSEDGKIAYGYIGRMSWSNGADSTDHAGVNPYAFTFKAEGESLEIADFKMTGTDPRAFSQMMGKFVKVNNPETVEAPKLD